MSENVNALTIGVLIFYWFFSVVALWMYWVYIRPEKKKQQAAQAGFAVLELAVGLVVGLLIVGGYVVWQNATTVTEPKTVFFTSKEDCEQTTGQICGFQNCDYIPPGKTFTDCGKGYVPISHQPTNTPLPTTSVPVISSTETVGSNIPPDLQCKKDSDCGINTCACEAQNKEYIKGDGKICLRVCDKTPTCYQGWCVFEDEETLYEIKK